MPYRYVKDIWSALRQLANNDVWPIVDTGAPTTSIGAAFAGPGSTYVNLTTGELYRNIGTKAAPVWLLEGAAVSGIGGLGSTGNAKMTYSFATDGGAVSTIVPTNSPTIPNGAIILGGTIDITTQLTSGGAATIALGTSAGSSSSSLKAATAVASWTVGQLALTPVFTAATYVKLTAAGRPNVTIATAALTAGVFNVNLSYLQA